MIAATPDLLDAVDRIAVAAGQAILPIYHAAETAALAKADGTPVTAADHASEAVILAALAELTPDIPVVSEEAVAAGHRPEVDAGGFWLVDPLDGTKEFIERRSSFTVNIALIVDGRPVLGVVLAPATGDRFLGLGNGMAWSVDSARRPIAVRVPPDEGLTVVASRSHGDTDRLERYLAGHAVAARTSIGSSLKFCLLAKGEADLYPRFGRTMEWDTAAGHAVLLAAGGRVETAEGAPLTYGKPGFENPVFIAFGGG